MSKLEPRKTRTGTAVRIVILAAAALSLAACGGSSAKTADDSADTTTTTSEQNTTSSGSNGAGETSVKFVDRARLTTTDTFTVVSCSRPDALGLELVAKGTGATKGTLTIHAANGTGTFKLSSENGSGSVEVSAGPDGALYVDKDIERATVTCGK